MYGPCMHALTIGHYPTSGKTGYIDKTKFGSLCSIAYLISRLITEKSNYDRRRVFLPDAEFLIVSSNSSSVAALFSAKVAINFLSSSYR